MGEIYLVRHAQASFNSENYDALSSLGLEQSQILAEHLTHFIDADFVISGSMQRHQQTAQAFIHAQQNQNAKLITESGFNEFNHQEIIAKINPDWQEGENFRQFLQTQNQPRSAFITAFLPALTRWMGGHHDGDYDEPWPSFKTRVVTALHKIKAQAGPSKSTVVFTSAGPISLLCQHILNFDTESMLNLNQNLMNTGVTKILYSKDQLSISYINNYSHLERHSREVQTLL